MTKPTEDAQISAELIRTMHDQVRGELTRVDSKSSTLLALIGTGLGVVVAVATRGPLPVPARIAFGAAALPLAVSVFYLLRVVRPKIAGAAFLRYRLKTTEAIVTEFEDEARSAAHWQAARLQNASQVVLGKFRNLRMATNWLVAGLVLVAIAASLAVGLG
ncbi:hypothetical protein FHX42_002667 [Saccharopolyspora lacisalsi]|uniref:Pycsar effector protein domain-containing protein n=1 Tax=Halosaccharopolyspora lacisalsi TaxID=1000566 RepID=A0A839DYM6_9PSEU|nr:Pycsar system effector family protein [Halosaccharopolyspora lacisalsi]MBA8825316.1 hypothetical protein [Halosaccharopolyspora lacisalsi]